jgi:hypothetical protein
MNGALVPRLASCWVCRVVAVVEDVTVRLFQPDGTRKRDYTDAAAYVRSIGYGSIAKSTLTRYLSEHAKHVETAMSGGPAAPGTLTRIEPTGPAHWLDVNQNAIDTGNAAIGRIAARLDVMEDKELVAVAKLGVTAAQKVGDWEAKGRKLAQVDELIKLASGRVEDPLPLTATIVEPDDEA